MFASVPSGAPILVIDAESNDETARLARAYGALVLVRPWEGFVETRRYALEYVRTPWTFMLDADEMIDQQLRDALLGLEPPSDVDGYIVRRTTFFVGRPIEGCGWGDESPLRLFRSGVAQLVPHPAGGGAADVHEEWRVPGGVELLHGRLLHDSYPTLAAYWQKFHRYTSIEARGLRPTAAAALRTIGVALARVFWLYFGRRGYRDGWRGAVIAFASAFYPVVVLFKAVGR
ncbi:MAG: glycosyltransferase family 2 protein [Candidatus Eremiobacteraeota bacterium]|nr:glycosyltransferase family 2 protein [Candidatus Eremiobacteraeota bacterium]